jgi:uncharacterized membrane protein YkoI
MIKPLHTIAILMAVMFAMPAMARDDDDREDHEEARRLQQAGVILPLETIIEKAQAIHAGRILEAELESKQGGHQYEIEILDEDGHVWELKLDAQTGQLLKQELED